MNANRRKVAALVLMLIFVAIVVAELLAFGTAGTACFAAPAIVFALFFVLNGGRTPNWMKAGVFIVSLEWIDDDAKGPPPRYWVPITFIGAAVIWCFVARFIRPHMSWLLATLQWLPMFIAVVLSALIWLLWIRRTAYVRKHEYLVCLKCAHPLDGLEAHGKCSECGEPFKADEVRGTLIVKYGTRADREIET